MANIIMASTDAFTRKNIQVAAKLASHKNDVIDGTNDEDLLYHLKSASEGDIVIFDKLFLSYFLEEKLSYLNFLNPKLRIFFCETGYPSRFFGYRLNRLKMVNGYIADIERKEETAKIICNITSGQNYFPKEVLEGIEMGENRGTEKQYSTEVSSVEMLIGLHLGEGMAIKEISRQMKRSENNVSSHLKRLRRKVGYKNMNDFIILNNQLRRFYIGSWNDCKN